MRAEGIFIIAVFGAFFIFGIMIYFISKLKAKAKDSSENHDGSNNQQQ